MVQEKLLLHKLAINHGLPRPGKAKNGTRSQEWAAFCALDCEPVDGAISILIFMIFDSSAFNELSNHATSQPIRELDSW